MITCLVTLGWCENIFYMSYTQIGLKPFYICLRLVAPQGIYNYLSDGTSELAI